MLLPAARSFSGVFLILTPFFWIGCDSQSPTQVEAPMNAAGVYAGQAVLDSATPSGHCFTKGLELQGGSHAFAYRLELTQSDRVLDGALEALDFAQRCPLEGTIDANGDLFVDQVRCSPSCVTFAWAAEEGTNCFLRACSATTSIAGSLARTNGPIDGRLRIEWSTFDGDTNEDLGRVIATGDIRLARVD